MAASDVEVVFDIDAAIASFASDPSRQSFELPRMTTGQRKEARRLAEQHADTKCESFGQGADRRLRLIKTAGEPHEDQEHEDLEAKDSEGALDVEALIAEFLADSERSSLELPRMTTGQRKQAKRIAEQHPRLKCESFGFAADRRLHLFKTETGEAASSASTPCEGNLLPTRLSGNIKACAAEEPRCSGECSPGASTCASDDPSPSPTNLANLLAHLSPTSSDRGAETPSLPEGLQVRNTFICGIDDEPVDNRAVRSMPHGMFRQNLLEDICSQAGTTPAASRAADGVQHAAMPPSPPVETVVVPRTADDSNNAQMFFAPGIDVVISGLLKAPAFNGLVGTVQSFDEESSRYNILLPAPVGPTGQRWAKVKGENLCLSISSQPPRFAPAYGSRVEHNLAPVLDYNAPSPMGYEAAFPMGFRTQAAWCTMGSPTAAR